MSPVILRAGPYRFHFYSKDRGERPHVHVRSEHKEAKFWLAPVELARNKGFQAYALRTIERIVREHEAFLMAAWEAFFGGDDER